MKKPTDKIQIKKITLNHTVIKYAVRGMGSKNIIFLHGLNTSWRFWQKVLTNISPQFTCYAPSLPKYGQYRLNHYVDAIEEFLKIKAPKETYLVGHSLGGIITLRLAARGIDFKKIILVNVPLFSQPPDLTTKTFNFWKKKLESDPIIKKTFLLIPSKIKRFRKFFMRAPLESYLEGFSDVIKHSIESDVKTLNHHQVPLLIVDGRFDFLLWTCRGKSLYQKLKPEAIIKLYTTHFIPESHPKKLAQIINQFFTEETFKTENNSALLLPKVGKFNEVGERIFKRIAGS